MVVGAVSERCNDCDGPLNPYGVCSDHTCRQSPAYFLREDLSGVPGGDYDPDYDRVVCGACGFVAYGGPTATSWEMYDHIERTHRNGSG